jgi:hypothetical protein
VQHNGLGSDLSNLDIVLSFEASADGAVICRIRVSGMALDSAQTVDFTDLPDVLAELGAQALISAGR